MKKSGHVETSTKVESIRMTKGQSRFKIGEVMGHYYNELKKEEDVDRELMDSSCTDISTQNALKILQPKCPLKLKELIKIDSDLHRKHAKNKHISRQQIFGENKSHEFEEK